MPVTVRGGYPFTRRFTLGASGTLNAATGQSLPEPTNAVRVTNAGANAVRLYWTAADYTADENYEELAAGAVWSEPAELLKIWARSTLGTTLVITGFARRG